MKNRHRKTLFNSDELNKSVKFNGSALLKVALSPVLNMLKNPKIFYKKSF